MHRNDPPAALIGPRMNKWFKYRKDASIHQFRTFEVKGSLVIYSTHLGHFTCSAEKCWEEMAEWNEVEPPANIPGVQRYQPQLPALPQGMADSFGKLFTLLEETTEKVKIDKGFLEQARATNELAQTAINLGKLQVEAYKLLLGK